ncbi:Phosphoglycolate phosphatase, prokaryotic: HAD-superfamily hydrolase [Thioalkalivibrio nitratireducens DSM 14787]|uniref:Phosphoglycolate phosphatase n=1 Tax=Thioalkalivibrio nitratireducens (strain DSM 14787 / UNIQEM 213 / ALEN2) TaxID=1255043 RepID=L0DUN4_THIND|nr:phosphoglycolate phosphatase [Thioalkalivibrio nitratireducens]AGA32061.1 Phosphoglycolate phosphatase, prokaryotic: HAD-superfamily hydrolase [Thioalkalivibrio nitratireducens DSM 14787]
MSLPRPKMILIDLDGTLIDSVPDLAFCVDAMMRELGLPERGEAAVRTWVGNGVERLVQRALANDLDALPAPDLYKRALPVFLRLYQENTSGRSRPYPGVREGLDRLQADGYRLGCVTNKAERFTLPLLRDTDILDAFELVVSGDTLAQKKPHPAPLLHAAASFGVAPAESLMVGDSRSDVKAARAAGFRIVCMSYGYNHGADIRDEHPDAVLDRLDQLPELLRDRAA